MEQFRLYTALLLTTIISARGDAQYNTACVHIGGGLADDGRRAVALPNGGVAIVGTTYSYTNGVNGGNGYLIVADPNGDISFNVGYGSAYFTQSGSGNDLAATPDGGYIVVGRGRDIVMGAAKIDAQGFAEWGWASSAGAEFFAVSPTLDGNYLAASAALSNSTSFVLVKFADTGEVIWAKQHTFPTNFFRICDMVAVPGGGYALVFECQDVQGIRVARLDEDGNVAWAKDYASLDEKPCGIAATADGELIIAGSTYNLGQSAPGDGLVVKLASDGAVIWTRAIGTADYESFRGVAKTSDGNFLLTGGASAEQASHTYVVKINEDGDLLWSEYVGTMTYGNDIVELTDGALAVAGVYVSGFGFYDQAYLHRLAPDGSACIDCGVVAHPSLSLPAEITVQDIASTPGEATIAETTYVPVYFGPGTFYPQCLTTAVPAHPTKPTVLVQPNPAVSHFLIRTEPSQPLDRVEVFDAQGRLCLVRRAIGRTELDVWHSLPTGAYRVNVLSLNGDRSNAALMIADQ